MKPTPEQNKAMIKVHQLLEIAEDIALGAELAWLAEDLGRVHDALVQFHKDANK